MQKRHIVIISFVFLFVLAALLVYAATARIPSDGATNWAPDLRAFLEAGHNDAGVNDAYLDGSIAFVDFALGAIPILRGNTGTDTSTIAAINPEQLSRALVWVTADVTESGAATSTFTITISEDSSATVDAPADYTCNTDTGERGTCTAVFKISDLPANTNTAITSTLNAASNQGDVINAHTVSVLLVPAP